MKKSLVVFLLLINIPVFCQTILIKHLSYTTTFDTVKHYPVLVTYWVTKKMVNCKNKVKRSNSYRIDPKLRKYTNLKKYYYKSGYDRGHNAPASTNKCNGKKIERETYFYSNMVPQYPNLNRGSWKRLEEKVIYYASKYDSIYVWSGSIGNIKKLKGVLSVPEYCWKIIYIKDTNSYSAYIFKNAKNDLINGKNGIIINICDLEKLTKINISQK